MNVGQYIKQLRTSAGYSQEQLGTLLGVKRAAVQKWECGTVQNLKRETIAKMSEIFNVSPSSFIISDTSEFHENSSKYHSPTITEDYTTFPVIGEVAAGYDIPALEDWSGDTIDVPNNYLRGRSTDEFFVLKVKGDSMYPTYQNGDKVLVLKQSTLNYSGQVGVVLYDDDLGTLKKVEYKKGEDWMNLVPVNPAYPPIRITGEALEHCRILGIPKLLIREIEE